MVQGEGRNPVALSTFGVMVQGVLGWELAVSELCTRKQRAWIDLFAFYILL